MYWQNRDELSSIEAGPSMEAKISSFFALDENKKYGVRVETSLDDTMSLGDDEIQGLIDEGVIPENYEDIPAREYSLGDYVENSTIWQHGYPTKEKLFGASAIEVTGETSLQDIVEKMSEYASCCSPSIV